MKIYKLTPLDLSNHHWKASIFRGEIIIRAENEDRARTIATNALWIATPAISGALTLYNPWERLGGLSECCKLLGSDFNEDGEEAILSPSEYDANWRR